MASKMKHTLGERLNIRFTGNVHSADRWNPGYTLL